MTEHDEAVNGLGASDLAALFRLVHVAYEAGPGFTVKSVRLAVQEAFALGKAMSTADLRTKAATGPWAPDCVSTECPHYQNTPRAKAAPEITEEMVERALDEYFDGWDWKTDWGANSFRKSMRAALTAALTQKGK